MFTIFSDSPWIFSFKKIVLKSLLLFFLLFMDMGEEWVSETLLERMHCPFINEWKFSFSVTWFSFHGRLFGNIASHLEWQRVVEICFQTSVHHVCMAWVQVWRDGTHRVLKERLSYFKYPFWVISLMLLLTVTGNKVLHSTFLESPSNELSRQPRAGSYATNTALTPSLQLSSFCLWFRL